MNDLSIIDDRWVKGRLLPTPTLLTQPFWDALLEGRLVVQQCQDCGYFVFRPEVACTRCFGGSLAWVESAGRGVLYGYSVVHRAPHPDMQVPFVIAVVALDEGWHMMTNLVGCPLDGAYIGMRVKLRATKVDHLALPFFEPA